MKRLLPAFLCAAMLLTACGEPTGDSESPAVTTAASVTDAEETATVPEQTDDSGAVSGSEKTTADRQTATSSAPAETDAKHTDAPAPAPAGNDLPVIGGDDSSAEKPGPAVQTEPAIVPEPDDDGVIELPVIPLR